MATSSAPGPDDRAALSSWERRVLAQIENDLAAGDPRLARAIGRGGSLPTPWWWPISVRSTVLLLVALGVLIVAAAVTPASWWPLLGLITVVVVVPWILLCVSESADEQRGSG
jgi:Protein of unknown function (DUF3040)